MNEGRHKILLQILPVLFMLQTVLASSAGLSTRRGNELYEKGQFEEAVRQYDLALIGRPEALEPKFNKANSYYRLDDLGQAMNLYREVAAESKDMKLVTKAKYNLGNCSFQQGSKQRDSNLQKAIEEMETSIGHWRAVLDIDPENKKAAKNIEVARLIIKDILDQLKNQQQDPNQPQDPNQQQQAQDPNQGQQQQGRDPNTPQDPNEQQSQQEQQQQQQNDEKKQAPDTTAQEILDKEQRDKKQRQILQRAHYQKVEKDW